MTARPASIWDSPVAWHQPDGRRRELVALLDNLGVGPADAAAGTGAVDEPAAPAEPGPAVPAAVEPASALHRPTTVRPPLPATAPGGRLGGLAGGVLLGAAGRRLRSAPRRRTVPTASRPGPGQRQDRLVGPAGG